MKSYILVALATLSLIGTLPAQIIPPIVPYTPKPGLINYQGRVVVGTTNFNGTGRFKFALVVPVLALFPNYSYSWRNDGIAGGTSEPTTSVALPVVNGLYSVLLGDTALTNMAAIPASVFTAPSLRLRVWFNDGVNGFQQLSPDQRLAPTAYLADGVVNSATIANEAITSSKIAPNAITSAQIASGTLDATRFATPDAPVAGQVLGYGAGGLTWFPSVFNLIGTNAYYNGGNVGIGGANPTSKLHVFGDLTATKATFGTRPPSDNSCVTIEGGAPWTPVSWKGSLTLNNESAIGWRPNLAGQAGGIGHSNGGLYVFRTTSQISSTAGVITYDLYINDSGNVGIGTTGPVAKLDVNGTTRTKVLTITGGADIAEPFPMKEEELEKGSVVVIDDEHPGRLKRSGSAYDTRVAGIISGANGINAGIALHQEGVLEGGQNVALSGRVYVRADASSGPIKPGDLLTTSDTPGHAMKVTEHARAQGAVIGKAMSSLGEGTGMVLVLVTLQ